MAQVSKVLRLRETAPGQSRVPFSLSSLGSSVSWEWSNKMQPNCWWFYLACSLQHLTKLRNWTYYFLISLSSSPVYSATDQSILTHVPPKKILLIFRVCFMKSNNRLLIFQNKILFKSLFCQILHMLFVPAPYPSIWKSSPNSLMLNALQDLPPTELVLLLTSYAQLHSNFTAFPN